MKARRLQLVPFADKGQVSTLNEAILGLGFEVDVYSSAKWLTGEHQHLTGDCIEVVSFIDNDLPWKRIISRLARSHTFPRLAVLKSDMGDWGSGLLEHFDDFVGWPCQGWELSLRLSQLYSGLELESFDDQRTAEDELLLLNMVGKTADFVRVIRLIRRMARCDASVLIEGETGTGKELAARAIHYLSTRRDYPFVALNCGALADNLVENELFGHARGAYTDAKDAHTGLIAQAENGTLFLDEVDSLAPRAQVSLLRFLQDKEYRPLGSKTVRKADVRVTSASNRSLAELVQEGRFRKDLFFRINLMNIVLPPLRERREDIPLIAEHLMERYRREYKQFDKFLHPDSVARFERYHWPGNVRELENIIHREFLLAEGAVIRIDEALGVSEFSGKQDGAAHHERNLLDVSLSEAKANFLCEFEKEYLRRVLAETEGNVTLAAERAGKERRAFGKLLKKYGINRLQFAVRW